MLWPLTEAILFLSPSPVHRCTVFRGYPSSAPPGSPCGLSSSLVPPIAVFRSYPILPLLAASAACRRPSVHCWRGVPGLPKSCPLGSPCGLSPSLGPPIAVFRSYPILPLLAAPAACRRPSVHCWRGVPGLSKFCPCAVLTACRPLWAFAVVFSTLRAVLAVVLAPQGTVGVGSAVVRTVLAADSAGGRYLDNPRSERSGDRGMMPHNGWPLEEASSPQLSLRKNRSSISPPCSTIRRRYSSANCSDTWCAF